LERDVGLWTNPKAPALGTKVGCSSRGIKGAEREKWEWVVLYE